MEPMHPSDRSYRNQTVRISDLTVVTDVIERVTFENCVIEGPAVIALLGGTTFKDNGMDGDIRSIIWPVPRDREHVIGAIALIGCLVVGCSLRRIGLAVPEDQQETMLRGFGVTP